MGLVNWLFHGVNDAITGIKDAYTEATIDITTALGLNQDEFKEQLAKGKYKPPPKTAKILAVVDMVFRERSVRATIPVSESAINALTRTLDTTSYPDRAILTLKNERGFDAYLTSATIDGKRIMMYSGENGELIHDQLKRDDDIRRNGEKVFEVGNEFIVDAEQVAKIADYWYKFLGKKKHMYAVQIPGLAYWYEVGDWYTFQAGRADSNEYIDTTVEIYAVDCEKTNGGIGTTSLLLREVEESWAKSTLYATRLASGGSPKRRVNRSNIVTVASVEYDGTYDYKCDGTDDDVQIQAAIDYSNSLGGGIVQLTAGTYQIDNTITMKSNIVLTGAGASTILKPKDASSVTIIDFSTSTDSAIDSFAINGDGSSITITTGLAKIIDGQTTGKANKIDINNYSFESTSGSLSFFCFYELFSTQCTASNNTVAVTGTSAILYLFYNCSNVSSCVSMGNSASGASVLYSYRYCTNIIACTSDGNSTSGTNGYLYSFGNCINISSCTSINNSTTGSNASVYSYIFCTNMSSCSSSDNTTSGATATINSFDNCTRITVCSTASNVSSATDEYGFYQCKSVQQCKSSGDSIPYGTGATQSYADSGTTNACADTAAGGYNS